MSQIFLSKHFTLEELTFSQVAARHGWDNAPTDAKIANLTRLCEQLLEPIRSIVNAPVHVTSGYRSPSVNARVGGKSNSQHIQGCAADIKVPGVSPDELIKAIIGAGLPYEQVIREFNAWTHISIPNSPKAAPRKQALIIDAAGTRIYTG